MNYPDFDKVTRQLIEKETEIVNQRTNWSLVLQSFLLTAYWYVSKSSIMRKEWYLGIIIIVGMVYSMSTIYSIWSNERAIASILFNWENFLKSRGEKLEDYPPVWAGSEKSINNTHGVESPCKRCRYEKIMFRCGFLSMYKLQPRLFLFVWVCVGILFLAQLFCPIPEVYYL